VPQMRSSVAPRGSSTTEMRFLAVASVSPAMNLPGVTEFVIHRVAVTQRHQGSSAKTRTPLQESLCVITGNFNKVHGQFLVLPSSS
jgi:hypothetical protein